MELVGRVLPVEADRAGGHLQWLGERESLVFANTFASGLLARGLQNCITGLAEAVNALEQSGTKPVARPSRGDCERSSDPVARPTIPGRLHHLSSGRSLPLAQTASMGDARPCVDGRRRVRSYGDTEEFDVLGVAPFRITAYR